VAVCQAAQCHEAVFTVFFASSSTAQALARHPRRSEMIGLDSKRCQRFRKMVFAVVWAVLAAAVGNARGETSQKTFPDCSWKGSTSVSYYTDFTCYDVPSTGYAAYTIREVRARRDLESFVSELVASALCRMVPSPLFGKHRYPSEPFALFANAAEPSCAGIGLQFMV